GITRVETNRLAEIEDRQVVLLLVVECLSTRAEYFRTRPPHPYGFARLDNDAIVACFLVRFAGLRTRRSGPLHTEKDHRDEPQHRGRLLQDPPAYAPLGAH